MQTQILRRSDGSITSLRCPRLAADDKLPPIRDVQRWVASTRTTTYQLQLEADLASVTTDQPVPCLCSRASKLNSSMKETNTDDADSDYQRERT